MRIDPPRDSQAPSEDEDLPRPVEAVARISSAIEKQKIRDILSEGNENSPGPFAQLVERQLGGGDSSVALDDPDRDAWTQEVIGSRIHWQYGPDGKRKPMFRHHTRRLDDPPETGA